MKFSLTTNKPAHAESHCLIVGIYENQELTPSAKDIDSASNGHLSKILDFGDFNGRSEQTLLLHAIPGIAAKRVLLVGLGQKKEFSTSQFMKFIAVTANILKNAKCENAICYLTDLEIAQRQLPEKIRLAIEVLANVFYSFDQLKSKKADKPSLREFNFFVANMMDEGQAKQAIKEGEAITAGITLTRDLGNLPANICTPTYLAEQAQVLANEFNNIHITVLDREQMEKLGMGAFLAVAKGSIQPPKLIVLEYRGTDTHIAPIALVGKGVTFDSGGISLKPPQSMDEMKYDMCGAASVLGSIKAAAQLKLPLNIVGVIAATENLPGGNATKPGDIVTSMSGQTIEILNTDAEGRLILSDALTYSEKFKPAYVIDIATLTGAIIIALGQHASGLFSNNEQLAKEIQQAAQQSFDRVWELPLWDEYQPNMDSNFADIANVSSDRSAGATNAACFLSRFCKNFKWAHLDVAATAFKSGKDKGATGRPVPLLVQFLINQSQLNQ